MVNKHLIGRILMFLLLFLVLIGGLLLVFEVKKKNPETTSVPPGEIPTPQATQIRSESRWATDSAVLEIESGLRALSQDIKGNFLLKGGVDLEESKLLPPILDMEVKF